MLSQFHKLAGDDPRPVEQRQIRDVTATIKKLKTIDQDNKAPSPPQVVDMQDVTTD